MADPNQTTGGVPPKPAEASKIQPKKETVRISLPPKPQAKETVRLNLPPKPGAPQPKMNQPGQSLGLLVPQVTEVDTSVKIPTAAPEVMTTAAPQAATAGKAGAAVAAPAAATAAPAAAVAASKKGAPGKALAVPATGTGKASKLDVALALVAAVVAIAGLVRLFMLG